jgi:amidohydrolase
MPFRIDNHLRDLTELRHHLHSLAEVSGSEKNTADAINKFLKETSPDHLKTGVGGYGILATYEGNDDRPHVLIRCELDALPIQDGIEEQYRSNKDEVGHKCGHDGHMSIVCGVARFLGEQDLDIGKVSLLFQPAEETGQGAGRVLEDKNFQEIKPDYCFALHNLPGFKKHQLVIRENVFAAASVGLIVHLKGNTAHAAHPEQGKSPAQAMIQLVQSFSSIPQFYSSLDEAVKVTVIHANLGERAFGTSPGKATVMSTLRTYQDEILDRLKAKCTEIAEGTAQTYKLSFDCEWVESFPATVNDDKAVEVIRFSAKALGYDVVNKSTPFSWSEDFGHFTREIPGAMFGLGIGEDHPPLHAEEYDFPDEVIPTGVSVFIKIIKQINASE